MVGRTGNKNKNVWAGGGHLRKKMCEGAFAKKIKCLGGSIRNPMRISNGIALKVLYKLSFLFLKHGKNLGQLQLHLWINK